MSCLVKPDVLLMTTLQTSAATLVIWLTVWAEKVTIQIWTDMNYICRWKWIAKQLLLIIRIPKPCAIPQLVSAPLQPARSSCSVHFVPRGYNLWLLMKMFQVLLQYFEDRFASFYVGEPLSNYNELLDRVKKAIPVLQTVNDKYIVVSYKDVSLETFINFDWSESLHVLEAFRNTLTYGSDTYRRVHLEVRESETFSWEFTSCSYEARNELSNLLAQVATCSAQTISQLFGTIYSDM